METLFENKCIYSKENLLELAKKTRPKIRDIVLFIMITFCTAYVIYSFIQYDYFGATIFLLLCAFVVGIEILLPYIEVNKALKRFQEIYHTEVETTILFYDDHMIGINEQTSGKTKTEYIQLIEVIQTKGLYLLRMKENINILVDKSGFIKGDRAAFEAFIKEKASKAKIRI